MNTLTEEHAEQKASAVRLRAAFHTVALGLMEWEDPPEPQLMRDVSRYLAFSDLARDLTASGSGESAVRPDSTTIHRAFGKESNYGSAPEADPFCIEDDWNEQA